MTSRRAVLGGLGASGCLIAAQKLSYLESRVAVARTSLDSRWYPFSEQHDRLLREGSAGGWARLDGLAINNRHLLDLRDFDGIAELELRESKRLISRTERWELSEEAPESLNDVGYTSLVADRRGDGRLRFSLFYAIHDVPSGIALARARALVGPYVKIGGVGPLADSRVLFPPARPRNTSHLSSPVVIWNAERQLWHLYFHYYSNQFAEGLGHQNTALATSRDLIDWDVRTGSDGDFLAVLPVTPAGWMNSQSTYHTIQRLPNGLWLAFLRGTSIGTDPRNKARQFTSLGFAVSLDGVEWALVPGAPQFPALSPESGLPVIQRPGFVGRLRDRYVVFWSEGIERPGGQRHRYAYTSDFQTFSDAGSGPIFPVSDGAICPWRDEGGISLISGPWLHRLARRTSSSQPGTFTSAAKRD